MLKLWLRSTGKGQVPYCLIWWNGSGGYAGTVEGDTFKVFPCSSKEEARLFGAAYLGQVELLGLLLVRLKESGYDRVTAAVKVGE